MRNHYDIWEKNVLGTEDSKSKGPKVGACLACSRTIKEIMKWEKFWEADCRFIQTIAEFLACHLSELEENLEVLMGAGP